MKTSNLLAIMLILLSVTFFTDCMQAQDSSPYSGTIIVDGDSIVVDGTLMEGQTEIINGQLLIIKTTIEDRDSTVKVQVISYKDSTYQFQVEKIDSFSIDLNGTMEKTKIGSSERILSDLDWTTHGYFTVCYEDAMDLEDLANEENYLIQSGLMIKQKIAYQPTHVTIIDSRNVILWSDDIVDHQTYRVVSKNISYEHTSLAEGKQELLPNQAFAAIRTYKPLLYPGEENL